MKAYKMMCPTNKLVASAVVGLGLVMSPNIEAVEVTDRTKMEVSGKVVGAVIADSNVSGIGSNNLANAFTVKMKSQVLPLIQH